MTALWFVALQYYRFMPNGRACSGDYIDSKKVPENYAQLYLQTWGLFFIGFTIAFYIVAAIVFLLHRSINNKHKGEYERKKQLLNNQVWKYNKDLRKSIPKISYILKFKVRIFVKIRVKIKKQNLNTLLIYFWTNFLSLLM